ncbi:unnamed protein product, partial [Ceratitis capitata]
PHLKQHPFNTTTWGAFMRGECLINNKIHVFSDKRLFECNFYLNAGSLLCAVMFRKAAGTLVVFCSFTSPAATDQLHSHNMLEGWWVVCNKPSVVILAER